MDLFLIENFLKLKYIALSVMHQHVHFKNALSHIQDILVVTNVLRVANIIKIK